MNFTIDKDIFIITVVFLAVIFLGLIVAIVALASSRKSTKAFAPPAKAVSAKAQAPTECDDDEIVAVIAAAVSAMAPDGVKYTVKQVTRTRPAGSRYSVWARAGLVENTRSF